MRGCRLWAASSKRCHRQSPLNDPATQADAGAPWGGCSFTSRCSASVCQHHTSTSCPSNWACWRASTRRSSWRWRPHRAPASSAAAVDSTSELANSQPGTGAWPAIKPASSAAKASNRGIQPVETQGGISVGAGRAVGRAWGCWRASWRQRRGHTTCQTLYESGICYGFRWMPPLKTAAGWPKVEVDHRHQWPDFVGMNGYMQSPAVVSSPARAVEWRFPAAVCQAFLIDAARAPRHAQPWQSRRNRSRGHPAPLQGASR